MFTCMLLVISPDSCEAHRAAAMGLRECVSDFTPALRLRFKKKTSSVGELHPMDHPVFIGDSGTKESICSIFFRLISEP